MKTFLAWTGLAIFIASGVFVYRDAKRLGSSSPGTWAVCAFLVPYITVPAWLIRRRALKRPDGYDSALLGVLGLLIGYGVPIGIAVALFGPAVGMQFILAVLIIIVLPLSIVWLWVKLR